VDVLNAHVLPAAVMPKPPQNLDWVAKVLESRAPADPSAATRRSLPTPPPSLAKTAMLAVWVQAV